MFNPEIGPLLAWSINPTLLGIPVQNLPIYACAALVGYVLWRIARVQKAEWAEQNSEARRSNAEQANRRSNAERRAQRARRKPK